MVVSERITSVDQVKKIAVIGAGIMGTGIAQVCATYGYEVTLRDISEEILNRAMETIKSGPFGLMTGVEKGKIKKEDAEAALARIKPTTDLREAAKDADVVIEAVPEILDLKKQVFKELDEICPPRTIFTSNTSSLMITDMAGVTKRADRFMGMHWMNPAPVMQCVELIRGLETSDETYKVIYDLTVKLGKTPVTCVDSPGFVTTRLIAMFMSDAIECLERGLMSADDIDIACRLSFGHPMGPITLVDFVGLDTILHVMDYLYSVMEDPKFRAPLLLRKMVQAGRLGVKTGRGFYEYEAPGKPKRKK